jgi:hypothetical protein
LTKWCRASYLPPADQLAHRIVAGESPKSQSMRNPSPADGDAVGVLSHGMCRCPPTSSSAHFGWTIATQWSLAEVVGAEVLAHEVERVVPNDRPMTLRC